MLTKFGRGFEWLAAHCHGWQFGEEGIIAALGSKIATPEPTFCEFGSGNPDKNYLTCATLMKRNWAGLLIDKDEGNVAKARLKLTGCPKVSIAQKTVVPIGTDSLDCIFRDIGFTPDVLVIDIDKNEYEFVREMNVRPTILCVEHHDWCDVERAKFPPIPDNCGEPCGADKSFLMQATSDAIADEAFRKGYTRVFANRINSIFVLKALEGAFQAPLKLDIGCGKHCREGWTPIDRSFGGLEAVPLPFEDNTADEIYASHVLEHFPYRETIDVLAEWVRVLKVGGRIKIAVPNLDWIMRNRNHYLFEGYLFGGMKDANDHHGAAFWPQKLHRVMIAAGLTDIHDWKSDLQDCAALPVSLNYEGAKDSLFPDKPRVEMVCSRPRYGPLDTADCAARAATLNGIGYWSGVGGGGWWEKTLQCNLEDMLAAGVDLAIVYDFDSMFSPQHVRQLIETMKAEPEIDALAAMQPMRGTGEVMAQMFDDHGNELKETEIDPSKPTLVRTAHFGLTAIKLNKLRDIPKPWFFNQPSLQGTWRDGAEGHVPADIHFWRQWEAYGRSLFMLPSCNIGHNEQVTSRIDPQTGERVYLTTRQWMNGVAKT